MLVWRITFQWWPQKKLEFTASKQYKRKIKSQQTINCHSINKIKHTLAFWQVNLLVGIYPGEIKTMFIPKSVVDIWRFIHMHQKLETTQLSLKWEMHKYTSNGILFSNKEKRKPLTYLTTWIHLKGPVLSEGGLSFFSSAEHLHLWNLQLTKLNFYLSHYF